MTFPCAKQATLAIQGKRGNQTECIYIKTRNHICKASTSLFNGDSRVEFEERLQATHVPLHAISHVQPNPYAQHVSVSHVLTFNLLCTCKAHAKQSVTSLPGLALHVLLRLRVRFAYKMKCVLSQQHGLPSNSLPFLKGSKMVKQDVFPLPTFTG